MKNILLSPVDCLFFYCVFNPLAQSPAIRSLFFIYFVSVEKLKVGINVIHTHSDFLSSIKGLWGK